MNGRETLETNRALEFAERLLGPGFAADVIAGGKDVRGVETNTKPFRFAHIVDDVSDLLERMAKT